MPTIIDSLGFEVDTRDLRKAEKDLDGVAKSAQRTERRTEKATSGLSRSFKKLGRAVVSTKGAVVALVGVLQTRAIVDTTLKFESLENSLNAATGSMKSAQESMSFVRSESRRLGIDLVASAQSFTKLAASAKGTSLEGAQARDIFTAVAEASRVMGLSAFETEGALTAISQIISKGTVQAEELRGQLGERLPGAFQIASRAMGVTTAELGKMLQNGEVMAEDLLPKLATELRASVSGGLPRAVDSAGAAFARLGNSITELENAIGRSGLVDFLADVAEGASEVLDSFSGAEKVAKQYNEISDAAVEYGRAQSSISNINQGLAQSQDKIQEAIDRVKAAREKEISTATKNVTSERALSAIRDKFNAKYAGQISALREAQEKSSILLESQLESEIAKREEAKRVLDEYVEANKQDISPTVDIAAVSMAEEVMREYFSTSEKASNEILRLNAFWQAGLLSVQAYSDGVRSATKDLDQSTDAVTVNQLSIQDIARTLTEKNNKLVTTNSELLRMRLNTLGASDAEKELLISLQETNEELERQKRFSDDVGNAFGSAASDIILNAKSARDAIRGLGNEIARLIVQRSIAEPIAKTISEAIPDFDGGGFTGSGPRSGGVDGKGGFPAILHPNETVIDNTKTSSNREIKQVIQIDARGASPGTEERIRQAAAEGARRGYESVAHDMVTNGPIRRSLPV